MISKNLLNLVKKFIFTLVIFTFVLSLVEILFPGIGYEFSRVVLKVNTFTAIVLFTWTAYYLFQVSYYKLKELDK